MTALVESTGLAGLQKRVSVEEYFRLSDESREKLEYYNGIIQPMSGAAFTHNQIATNIIITLGVLLRDTDLIVSNSDTKIHVPGRRSFLYPDAVLVSRKAEFFEGRPDIITNPLLIVEVASPSTRGYDLDRKSTYYRSVPSLQEYVFVESHEAWMSSLFRQEGDSWHHTEAAGPEAALALRSVGVSLPLAEVYRKVEFA